MTKKQMRVVAFGLTAAMALSAASSVAFAENTDGTLFSDVPETAWYYTAVEKAVDTYGFMSGRGDGSFSPDSALTREEFVQILYNMSEVDTDIASESDVQTEFSDVDTAAWYAPAVAWAADMGVTSGVGNGKFGVGERVSREEVALFIQKYCSAMGVDLSPDTAVEAFSDMDSVSSWATDAVVWAHQSGLFLGDDGKFLPSASATRAEAASVLCNLMDAVTTEEEKAAALEHFTGDSSDLYQVADYIYGYLTDAGFSPAAACGILGNIYQECRFHYAEDVSGGTGLFQYIGGRRTSLVSYCEANGYDYLTPEGQLAFMLNEDLTNQEYFFGANCGISIEAFTVSTDAATAATQWCQAFERAGIPMMNTRNSIAQQFYERYANGSIDQIGDLVGDPATITTY